MGDHSQPQQSQPNGRILLLIGGEHGHVEDLLREHEYGLVVPAPQIRGRDLSAEPN